MKSPTNAYTNRPSFRFLLLGALAMAAHARATTYYVATNGNDAAAGTATAPFKTVAYAVDKMVAGDTTYVRSGVYKESRAAIFRKSGTQSAPIRLLAAPGQSPVIDYSAATDYMRRVVLQAPGKTLPIGWIVIEGFEIRNSPAPIMIFNAHDVVIRRNWIHHGRAQGILGNGKNVLIDSNVVSQNGGRCLPSGMSENEPKRSCNQFHGMYLTGSNFTVVNNLVYDNLASGIQVAGYPWCEDGNCYGGGSTTKTDATYAGAADWLIANNTIAYNGYGPGLVMWQSDAINSRIINNIFYENGQGYSPGSGGQGVSFWSCGKGHVLRNNFFYATAPGGVTPIGGSTGWATKYTEFNSIVNVSPPGFKNAPATISGVPDFTLRVGAPVIDMGLTLAEVTWDHLGASRPYQGAYDIGAYEFGGSSMLAGVPRAPEGLIAR